MVKVHSPLQAQLVQWLVAPGDTVRTGDVLVILESMKMEHEVRSPADGQVYECLFGEGETVGEKDVLVTLAPATVIPGSTRDPSSSAQSPPWTPGQARGDAYRADLQRVLDRHALTLDAARPQAVDKRHALGLRTARENVADLCDAGSFVEYGALAVAAQRSRRSEDDLQRNTPADGMVTGIGAVNGALFG